METLHQYSGVTVQCDCADHASVGVCLKPLPFACISKRVARLSRDAAGNVIRDFVRQVAGRLVSTVEPSYLMHSLRPWIQKTPFSLCDAAGHAEIKMMIPAFRL